MGYKILRARGLLGLHYNRDKFLLEPETVISVSSRAVDLQVSMSLKVRLILTELAFTRFGIE